MNARITRMEWIRKALEKIREKELEPDKEKLIAELMFRFFVSRRIAMEDLNACLIFMRF